MPYDLTTFMNELIVKKQLDKYEKHSNDVYYTKYYNFITNVVTIFYK